jgi:replication factor A3
MASEATPRINAHYLEQFVNRTVRMVGKVVALRGETATLDASGNVNIILNLVRG